jgi:hypothetical protein
MNTNLRAQDAPHMCAVPHAEHQGEADASARRLRKAYCRLLRRASKIGWNAARAEYISRVARAGNRDDLFSDLAIFDDLTGSYQRQGIDPVSSQRRQDVFKRFAVPLSLCAGIACMLAMAESGRGVFAGLGLSIACIVAVRIVGSLMITLLVS